MELNIFSDCAYVESNSLIQLIDFYSALRSELFFDDIFFNASLCMGKLGTSKSDSTFVKSTIFKDTSTVKVYQMQNNFKGIGITIDKDIVVSNKGEKTICNKLVKSFYQPNANELKFIEYWDIKYNRPNSTELAFLLIIQHLITTYSKQKLLNKNAARYYISAISTIISQLNKTDIINENGTTITHTEITKYILSLRSNDYVSYNLFIILFAPSPLFELHNIAGICFSSKYLSHFLFSISFAKSDLFNTTIFFLFSKKILLLTTLF